MNKIFISIIVLTLLLLFSCTDESFYYKKETIVNNNWKFNDTIKFEVNVLDTTQFYDLFFTIESTQEYSNSNFWLFVTTKSPEAYILKDTLEFFLADAKGKWYGKKSSDKFKSIHYFKKQVIFPKIGTYSFAIQQGMRNLNLTGISEFGLMIKESGKKQTK